MTEDNAPDSRADNTVSDTKTLGADDIIQPFMLETSNLRGRLVQLGPVVNDILQAHDYPKPVAHLVAETLILSLLLSSMLKYEGIFTLQTKGDGPISMLVADVTSQGHVRACASFDPERLENARQQLSALKSEETAQNHLAQYLGKGYIAFTVDQASETARYQGIVELQGASLIDCVQHYFNQSEQINTGIKMSIGQRDDVWRASGIMVQDLPDEEQDRGSNLEANDWRRTMIFLESCTNDELLDAALDPQDLLFRLFHEEGVRVFETKTLKKECRCEKERVEGILYSMSEDDLDYMSDDGVITMHCEFCGCDYTFDQDEILKSQRRDRSDNPK